MVFVASMSSFHLQNVCLSLPRLTSQPVILDIIRGTVSKQALLPGKHVYAPQLAHVTMCVLRLLEICSSTFSR